MSKKYIISITDYSYRFSYTTFIGKGTYVFQGEKYRVLANRDQAQIYTSLNRAKAAIERIRKSDCVNVPYLAEKYTIMQAEVSE